MFYEYPYKFVSQINTMVITQLFTPSIGMPYLVQIKYPNGGISFHTAYNEKDALNYGGKIIAIFKPKK